MLIYVYSLTVQNSRSDRQLALLFLLFFLILSLFHFNNSNLNFEHIFLSISLAKGVNV